MPKPACPLFMKQSPYENQIHEGSEWGACLIKRAPHGVPPVRRRVDQLTRFGVLDEVGLISRMRGGERGSTCRARGAHGAALT